MLGKLLKGCCKHVVRERIYQTYSKHMPNTAADLMVADEGVVE